MSEDDKRNHPSQKSEAVVGFPYSRVAPAQTWCDRTEPAVYGKLAVTLGAPAEQTTGHWCSQCHRIWFGYLLEVACPVCGNRHG